MDHQPVARVLADIARTASETFELDEIFDRVAASARELIPFNDMGVCRILEDGSVMRHASTAGTGCSEETYNQPLPLTEWSPRIRPSLEPIPRVSDARDELDPSFTVDARILAKGGRSLMWEPFRQGGKLAGGVWVSSSRPEAFTDDHQRVLAPIAALLGSAVSHWKMWDSERRRRKRLDAVEDILAALAEALDVRQIFESLSVALQSIVPHTLLGLSEHDVRDGTLRITASAGQADVEIPYEPVPMTADELQRRGMEHEIRRDIKAEVTPDTALSRLLLASGMRSTLRVPVRLSGEVRGSLMFMHREEGRYVEEDIEVARRVADRIALALSHHRLAEEARVAAAASERAQRLEATVDTLTRELEAQGRPRVIGVSRSWKEALAHAARVASSDTTVLLTGESGTGKEVVARLIHKGSERAARPIVAVNCAALPEHLLESELFGHEKGAFTGAVSTTIGRLEQAASGTLFLDEIAEMTPVVQAKFLRVLQEREFQRVGGTRVLTADVRIIAATNRDLPDMIRHGTFREDLYYRLNVFEIHLPPLRERSEDIMPLAESFLEELSSTIGRPAAGISRDAKEWLELYSWPGNVRELRNAIERAILLCDRGLITRDHLPIVVGRPEPARAESGNGRIDLAEPLPSGGIDLRSVNRSLIEKALRQARGNKSRAARLLGLTRSQFYTRLEKYDIS
ncbi:MAG TPA: sigma 54-interacting transcriptional regulator [Candidatus Polarisedimenticolia bacterium]|jgi:transcriptional regulator with GAF, ATPase, and Fis domain